MLSSLNPNHILVNLDHIVLSGHNAESLAYHAIATPQSMLSALPKVCYRHCPKYAIATAQSMLSPLPNVCSLYGMGTRSSVTSNLNVSLVCHAKSECHCESSSIAASFFVHSPKYCKFVIRFTTSFSSWICLKAHNTA